MIISTHDRRRSSGLIHTVAAPVQQAPAVRGGGEARRQPLGRRKQRRWENGEVATNNKLMELKMQRGTDQTKKLASFTGWVKPQHDKRWTDNDVPDLDRTDQWRGYDVCIVHSSCTPQISLGGSVYRSHRWCLV